MVGKKENMIPWIITILFTVQIIYADRGNWRFHPADYIASMMTEERNTNLKTGLQIKTQLCLDSATSSTKEVAIDNEIRPYEPLELFDYYLHGGSYLYGIRFKATWTQSSLHSAMIRVNSRGKYRREICWELLLWFMVELPHEMCGFLSLTAAKVIYLAALKKWQPFPGPNGPFTATQPVARIVNPINDKQRDYNCQPIYYV